MGARPRLITAPLRVGGGAEASALRPTPVSTPRTRRFDVEEYRSLAEDTWERISTRFYGDDRCAAALRSFNRNYPMASDLIRRDGALAPGEKVYVPPLRILMEQFDSLIRKSDSGTSGAVTTTPGTTGQPLAPIR